MAIDKLKGKLSPVQTLRGNLAKQNQTLKGQIANKGGVITDHRLLNHREDEEQHPISAITGLQDALDDLNEKISEPISFSLVSDGEVVAISNTSDEIREAVESGRKVIFSQESDDGVQNYELIGADWEYGSIVLQNSEGGTIRTAQLHYDGEQMTGDVTETILMNSNMEFIVYCGTATEVI